MLGQGAHTQLDAAQLVEVTDERVGRDADEAWRQSTLRYERTVGAIGEAAHGARHGDVLGEVEIVHAGGARGLGDHGVAVVRQARDHRVRRMRAQVRGQGGRVTRVQPVGVEIVEVVRVHDGASHFCVDVRDVDVVIAAFGQQAADQ